MLNGLKIQVQNGKKMAYFKHLPLTTELILYLAELTHRTQLVSWLSIIADT